MVETPLRTERLKIVVLFFVLRNKSTSGFMKLNALSYERNSPLDVSHTPSGSLPLLFRPFGQFFMAAKLLPP